MKFAYIKTYAVVVDAPKSYVDNYGVTFPTEWYTNEETAQQKKIWWKYEQGWIDTHIVEDYVECPVINDTVYIPDYVNR